MGLFYFMSQEVYILYSAKRQGYYIGQCGDVEARLQRHQRGEVPSTAPWRPWALLWKTKKANRSEAVRLERKLKNLSRSRLMVFMEKYKEDIVDLHLFNRIKSSRADV